MSGGIDSAVAALLLSQQGHELIGLTMQMSDQNDCLSDAETSKSKSCCGVSESLIARRVCKNIGIPHHVLNMKTEFKQKVIDPFISDYINGRTPSPCVNCNTFIKFDEAFKFADQNSCEFIATGHYANIDDFGRLCRSSNPDKDQTYFLAGVPRNRLQQMLFPLWKFETKEQVREIARQAGLENSEKRESQEICFVPGDYRKFLHDNVQNLPKEGDFVDEDGNVLGKHRGIHEYTIGQRRGTTQDRKFVIRVNSAENQIVLADKQHETDKIVVKYFNWIADMFPDCSVASFDNLTCKIRTGKTETRCQVFKLLYDYLEIHAIDGTFVNPAPGQFVVVYDGDVVLGGGTLC